MRRRAKPSKARVESKVPVVPKSRKNEGSRVRDLEKRLAEALKREAEALEQQTATSEILRIISSSPTDLQPVFDAIVRSAQRLLGTHTTSVFRRLADEVHLAAYTSTGEAGDAAYASLFPMSFDDYRERYPFAALDWVDGTVIHVPDVELDTRSPEISRRLAHARGFRSLLQVPMRREGHVIGLLGITRREAGAFADDEIALAQTFADQAVIAIENVRLLTETKESLEQQTATAEILRVISSSPTDVRPVFAAVLASAARLCDAVDATIFQVDDDTLLLIAHEGPIPSHPIGAFRALTSGTPSARAVLEARTIHVVDLQAEVDEYPEGSAFARSLNFRTVLSAPLISAAAAIGVVVIRRTEARPFTDRQVALLQTFADQAVIAIENVRLFKELQEKNQALTQAHAQVTEALEQQTATAEILRIIASSPTDLQPVLDAMAESAARLCTANDAAILRLDGDVLRSVAHHGPITYLPGLVVPAIRGTVTGRSVLDRQTVQVADLLAEAQEFPESSIIGRAQGHRTILSVPLLREGVPIGAIALRRTEVQPFTDEQITLLKTFADQAVIAIENVRLFTELQQKNEALTQAHAKVTEALDHQTATSEILRVISRSQTDVQPVFDTILRSAIRLCDGLFGALYRFDGELMHQVAQHNYGPEALAEARRAFPARPSRALSGGRAILDRAVVNLPDVQLDPEYQQAIVRAAGARSILAVPMLREGTVTGAIAVARAQPGLFSDNHVELL